MNICIKCSKKFKFKFDYNFSFHAKQYHSYTLTLDFESTLSKINKQITNATEHIYKHVANSLSFYFRKKKNTISKHSYLMKLMEKFNKLLQNRGKINHKSKEWKTKKNDLEEEKSEKFISTIKCRICNKVFKDKIEKN